MWPYIHGPAVINSDMSLFKSFNFGETKKLQFRLQAYNWLNHPNGQFDVPGNHVDDQLIFKDLKSGALTQTNQNSHTTGFPAYTVGNRLVEFAVKFYF
jgi:hypothetical protein